MYAAGTLTGRVALVTGGGSGIGLEIAAAFARLGAKVALVGRQAQRLEEAVSLLAAEGLTAKGFAADVRNYEQLKEAVDHTAKHFGSLDILVNNAAGNFHCPTATLSPNGWRTVIDIDLNGTFHGCHAAYEHLKRSAFGGNIMSVITMRALSGWPQAAHAAAAKAGILALSRSLAVEWGGDGIRVNTISPGPIGDSEGVRRLYEATGRAEAEARRTALGRFGTKTEVANAAIYLASDLSTYVTGENLIVDGGRWLKVTGD